LIFNGAPSFLANIAKDQYSEHVITINKVNSEAYTISLVMTGAPPGEIPTCAIGNDSSNPGKLDNHVDKGKRVNISIYAIEETKSIKIDYFYVAEEKRLDILRTVREDGHMDFRVDATKKDGSSHYYTAVYKRA